MPQKWYEWVIYIAAIHAGVEKIVGWGLGQFNPIIPTIVYAGGAALALLHIFKILK